MKAVREPPLRRGRPLSNVVERSVFAEALRLVALDDPSKITRRQIAEGAGVSRQTLYNRWPTTGDIVLDALVDRAADSIGVDSGGGLRNYLSELASAVDGWARPGLRAIATFAQLDDDFAARFRSRFLGVRHTALTAAIAAAVTDAPEHDVDVDLIAELIAGSLWYRVLLVDRPLGEHWVRQMATLTQT